MRSNSRESLEKAFDAGKLQFFNSLEPLQKRPAFTRHLANLKQRDWVVYAKAPFAGPQQVLDYVGRYTHRVAISNNRLLDIENDQIRFKWKDYRGGDQVKTMTLSSEEFIRRFLLHVLPNGFRRIRYYGFLGNRHREEKLAQCRHLLGMPQVEENSAEPAAQKDYRDRYEDLTGRSLRQFPHCRARRHGCCSDPPKLVSPLSGSRGHLMIRSGDSELAANPCRSFGTAGEVRVFRGFNRSDSLTWPVIPLSAATPTSQTVPTRKFHPHTHPAHSRSRGDQTIQHP